MSARTPAFGLAVTAALLLAACSNQADKLFVPEGAYSGSTSTDEEVNLTVNGGEVKLQGKSLKGDADGSFVEKKRKWRITCHQEKGSKDISCTWIRDGKAETIELMQL